LNNSNTGIFYIPDMGELVIVWRHVKFGALTNSKYSGWDVASLKEFASKSDHVRENVPKSLHQRVVETLGLRDVMDPSGYSMVDIAYLMVDIVKTTDEEEEKKKPIELSTARKEKEKEKEPPAPKKKKPKKEKKKGGEGEPGPFLL